MEMNCPLCKGFSFSALCIWPMGSTILMMLKWENKNWLLQNIKHISTFYLLLAVPQRHRSWKSSTLTHKSQFPKNVCQGKSVKDCGGAKRNSIGLTDLAFSKQKEFSRFWGSFSVTGSRTVGLSSILFKKEQGSFFLFIRADKVNLWI